ncbi:MAG: hypothetical protein Q7T01_04350 [bacterium]|nr:hypothetical protein [bacterium]
MHTVTDLIATGILRIAREPPGNATVGDLATSAGYTIPLIAHDYPAKTAVLWNAAYRAVGLSCVNAMCVANPGALPSIIEVLRKDPRYLGGGAGVGFKEAVMAQADVIGMSAALMGAANVLWMDGDGALCVDNTDADGFLRGLAPLVQERWPVSGLGKRSVLVLGAGGAGGPIALAFARAGANVAIVNRSEEKARRLAARISEARVAHRWPVLGVVVRGYGEHAIAPLARGADIVVNTTDKGKGSLAAYSALAPAVLPATDENVSQNLVQGEQAVASMSRSAIVADIAAFGGQTPMLQHAATRGLATQDALPMVVEQAIDAFLLVHRGIADRASIARIMWDAVGIKQNA